MTKLLVVVSVLMLLLMVASVYAEEPPKALVDALIFRESSGNDYATGDMKDKEGNDLPPSEWAYGCLQIKKDCLADYNRWNKTSYQLEDLLGNRELSIKVCKAYFKHYAVAKRFGRAPRIEDMARMWNGGQNGWKRTSTLQYWIGVKDYLDHHQD